MPRHITLSPTKSIPGIQPTLKRKENSSRGSCRRVLVKSRYRVVPASQFRNINLIPFRLSGVSKKHHFHGISLWLRIDSPMSNCCSHGTFLHFSLQSSHLNICYYHQDLHQRLFHPGLRQELHHNPRALLLIGAAFAPMVGHRSPA